MIRWQEYGWNWGTMGNLTGVSLEHLPAPHSELITCSLCIVSIMPKKSMHSVETVIIQQRVHWCVTETTPEVSKLTPENTRNSQVAKLSPAE